MFSTISWNLNHYPAICGEKEMDLQKIENKVREYLKKTRVSDHCILLYIEIIEETESHYTVIGHLQCKRTRRVRKIIVKK